MWRAWPGPGRGGGRPKIVNALCTGLMSLYWVTPWYRLACRVDPYAWDTDIYPLIVSPGTLPHGYHMTGCLIHSSAFCRAPTICNLILSLVSMVLYRLSKYRSVTEHFRAATEGSIFRNIIWSRCAVSIILAPSTNVTTYFLT